MAMTMDLSGTASDPAPTKPPQRRSRSSRVGTSMWVAVVAGVLAAGGILVGISGTKGVAVAVAARDLAAGETVGPDDFRFIDLEAPESLLGQLLRPGAVNALSTEAQVTTHAVVAGELVQQADLAATGAPSQQRSMSIPVVATHAVSGALKRGDTVDVIDASGVEPLYVLTNARVLAATDAGSSRLGGASRDYAITVAVDERSALRVAAAIAGGKLDVVRSTGAPVVLPSPATTTTVKR